VPRQLNERQLQVLRWVGRLPPGPAKAEAEAWIAWAESHVQRLNPLNGSPLLPEIPEPRTEDLQPFMHGWSPYGPPEHPLRRTPGLLHDRVTAGFMQPELRVGS
jgi:hypothetical protein